MVSDELKPTMVRRLTEILLSAESWNYHRSGTDLASLRGFLFGRGMAPRSSLTFERSRPSLETIRDLFFFGSSDVDSAEGVNASADLIFYNDWYGPPEEVLREINVSPGERTGYREQARQIDFQLISNYPSKKLMRRDEKQWRDLIDNPVVVASLEYKFWIETEGKVVKCPVEIEANITYRFSDNSNVYREEAEEVLPAVEIKFERVTGGEQAILVWLDAGTNS